MLVGGLLTAGPAAAHAELESTSPADGARLQQAPGTVSLTFGELVLLRRQSIQVVNREGRHIEAGVAFHPGNKNTVVMVRLRPSVPDDSYTVRFGIISQDGHPVSGAFTFVVGAGPLVGVNGLPAGDSGSNPAVGLLYGLGRWLSFCGLAVLGGLIFISTCWPNGAGSNRARRLLRLGWLSAAVGTVLSLLLLGPYGSEQGPPAMFSLGTFGETLRLPVGKVLVLRLIALIALIPIANRLLRSIVTGADDERRGAESLGLALAIPLLIGYSGSGHAESGTQPTAVVLSDMLHVGAMALWLGGVAMLAFVMLPSARAEELADALPIFSRTAYAAVCVLVATGCFQAWQQVRSVPLLWQTEYGRILLLKLAAVGLILLVGDRSRRVVQSLSRPGRRLEPVTSSGASLPAADLGPTPGRQLTDTDRRRLRAAVGAEIALALVILVLSAVLVAVTPARLKQAGPAEPSARSGSGGPPIPVSGYSNREGSPAPTRRISGSSPDRSITVVGSSPQSPESTTASSWWSSRSLISQP